MLLGPIAAAVFQQERLEGDLRSAHARLRAAACEAALSNASAAEQGALQVGIPGFKSQPLHLELRNKLLMTSLHTAARSPSLTSPPGLRPMQTQLEAAVANQRRLAAWHALQATLTRFLDYAGAIISYSCVALVIFQSEF